MNDVPNPLNLFWRMVREGDTPASEVLLFTFNHDLAFFERSALGMLQQTGARITLVADARMAHHDLYAVRRAGTAYLPGLAYCPGSFHPKVLVIAGEEQATVAIGSGNLSLSGWQGNDELWSTHRADRERGSSVVREMAPWLRRLPDVVRCGDGVAPALTRTARLLDGLGLTETTAHVVHSLERPILDQLPAGPIDSLALYAPFYDPGAHAVRALVARFQPTVIRVGVQPSLTRVDGSALAKVIGERGEVVLLGDAPYRHGKLIEWERDGQRWALTGSPNLSVAALLRSVRDGGNVEIGVIAPVESTLLPVGEPAPNVRLATISYIRVAEPPRPAVVLLSAVIDGDGLLVRLAGALRHRATLEHSPFASSPDTWRPVAEVSVGADTITVAIAATGGDRVQLRLPDGSTSTAIHVVDPNSVLRLRRAVPSGPRPPSLDEIFTDARAVEQLGRLIAASRETRRPPAAGGSPGGRTNLATVFELDSWNEYLDRCQGRIGADTVSFALGLPVRRARSSTQPVADIDWDDEGVDEDDLGSLEDDNADDVVDDAAEIDRQQPSLRHMHERVRRRYQTAIERMIANAEGSELVDRLLALRLALLLVAAGGWELADMTWRELVLKGVSSLEEENVPADYEDLAGSLAALALSIVHSTLERFGPTVTHVRFDQTVGKVDHLLLAATESHVEHYAEGLDGRFPVSSDAFAVLNLRDRLVYPDPIAEAVEAASGPGVHAFAEGRVVTVIKDVSTPLLLACEVLVRTEGVSPLVIRAGTTKKWASLLWERPTLVAVQPGKARDTVFCDVYSYPYGEMPSHDIRSEGRPSASRVILSTSAGAPLPEQAIAILDTVGLDHPAVVE